MQNLILDVSENARNFIYALIKDEQTPFDIAATAMWSLWVVQVVMATLTGSWTAFKAMAF